MAPILQFIQGVVSALMALTDRHKHHAIPSAVAGVVGIIAAVGASYVMKPAPQQHVVSTTGKPNRLAWGEMTQAEVDRLTVLLKAIPPGRRDMVGILCATRDCEDLSLDFDNAFESAGWKSMTERPIADDGTGLRVIGPVDKANVLAAAITKATDGRMAPTVLPPLKGDDRVLLVIRRKPK